MNNDTPWSNPLVPNVGSGSRITQSPELYLAADIEPYAKGGWKTTVKASVRVFDGSEATLYEKLENLLTNGLAIATAAIQAHESQKEDATNEQ